MIFRKIAARTSGLPYSIPQGLPERPLYAVTSPRPNLAPRWSNIFRRGEKSSNLAGGYIALIVILILCSIALLAALGFYIRRRRTQRAVIHASFPSIYTQEKRRHRSWQQYGNEWFGSKPSGEDTQSLVAGYSSRMPSIMISRPVSNALAGPTPIFSTKERESLHSVGIIELPDNSQHSPEAVYDPFTNSRPHSRSVSRSRSNSAAESLLSTPRSGISTPNTRASRSRNSSISSNQSQPRSQSHSQTRSTRPPAQNSYSYARTRSPSNGPSRRGTYQASSILPETNEEHDAATSKTSQSSTREKSLPPPPPSTLPQSLSPGRNSLSYIPSNPANWRSDPYSDFCRDRPAFDFADYEVLHETTQVIDIAIAGPLDIPQGPLTPLGEREAKAGAALGFKSTWYKSPQNVEQGQWLV